MVVAGTKNAVTMVEGGAAELSEEVMLGAIEFGHEVIKQICEAVEELREKTGWSMPAAEPVLPNQDAIAAVDAKFYGLLDKAMHSKTKLERNAALRAAHDEVVAALADTENDEPAAGKFSIGDVKEAMEAIEKKILRKAALSGTRIDGRKNDEVRAIEIEVGPAAARPRLGPLHPR